MHAQPACKHAKNFQAGFAVRCRILESALTKEHHKSSALKFTNFFLNCSTKSLLDGKSSCLDISGEKKVVKTLKTLRGAERQLILC